MGPALQMDTFCLEVEEVFVKLPVEKIPLDSDRGDGAGACPGHSQQNREGGETPRGRYAVLLQSKGADVAGPRRCEGRAVVRSIFAGILVSGRCRRVQPPGLRPRNRWCHAGPISRAPLARSSPRAVIGKIGCHGSRQGCPYHRRGGEYTPVLAVLQDGSNAAFPPSAALFTPYLR